MVTRFTTVAMVLLLAAAAGAQTTDLMISEYVEGSSYNKAIEIFNGTEDTVNLAGYALARYSNGGTSATVIPLGNADLASGETWVVTHPSFADLALADQTSIELNFNGDDAVVLTFNGAAIDRVGQVGVDPGDSWSCTSGTTANHTLRRLAGICTGDSAVDAVFDPCLQWTILASDMISGLGYHLADCGAVPADGTTWSTLKASFR